MRRVTSLILLLLCTLLTINVLAGNIVFKTGTKINGAGVQLYFSGLGTTYQLDKSLYSVTVESEVSSITSIYVESVNNQFVNCVLNAAPPTTGTKQTKVTLTYNGVDTGTALFIGTTFKPGPVLEVNTSTGETVFCEGSEVELIASGGTATSVSWQSSPDNSQWTTLAGQTDLNITVNASLGNTYYRFYEVATSPSDPISILGQVCCTTIGDQKVVWKETFDDDLFPYPNITRNQCQWVKGYTFKSTGKVDDGYYVVVACSNAAAPATCSWPSGKYDHTSGDGSSGFLIINAGAENKIMYEQPVVNSDGFCEGVYYNLSLYATNITQEGNAPARMAFDIVQINNDDSEIKLVEGYDSGLIEGWQMSKWFNYGVSFKVSDVANIKKIVVRLWNTGGEVQGNDIVIDDISLSVCQARVNLYADYPNQDITTECGDNIKLQAIEDGNLETYFGRTDPYYLWMKSVDDGLTWDSIHVASGYGAKEFVTTVKTGEQALYKTIIAIDGAGAKKVVEGTAGESCIIYTITNESKAQCEGGCTPPDAKIDNSHDKLTCDITQITLKAMPDGMTYLWEDNSTEQTRVVTAAGTYSVKVTGSDVECPGNASVTIDEDKPAIGVTAKSVTGATHIDCTVNSLELTAETTPDMENISYTWSPNGETTKNITVGTAGIYTVTAKQTTTGCQSVPSSIEITASTDLPVIEVESAMEACSPETLDISDAVISTTAEAVKYYSDAALQQPLTDTKITAPVIATYYIQGENSNGCKTAAKSVDVSLYELSVSAISDSTIFEGGTAKLWGHGTGVQAGRYTMQFYSDGNPIADPVTGSVINVAVTPSDTTAYQLVAINGTCIGKFNAVIYVKPLSPIKIPKYFTPNGDGLNDVWHITNIEAFPNAIIYIYDRYSKLLVKLNGTDDGWDGTYNGHPMPMADYWFLISDEQIGNVSGHFILKR